MYIAFYLFILELVLQPILHTLQDLSPPFSCRATVNIYKYMDIRLYCICECTVYTVYVLHGMASGFGFLLFGAAGLFFLQNRESGTKTFEKS